MLREVLIVLGYGLAGLAVSLVLVAISWWPLAPTLILQSMPNPAYLYAQALVSAIIKRGVSHTKALKPARIQVSLATPVTLSKQRLGAFLRLAQFSTSPAPEAVPLTYPIVESFRLIIQAMLLPAFPFNILGSVLTRHTTTMFRPIQVDEPLMFSVCIEPDSWHVTAKGDTEVDMVSEALSATDNKVVWRAVTTAIILNPKRAKGGAKEQAATAPDASQQQVVATWRLGGDVGRRYGLLNGDLNPIHVHPLTARLFGFKRPIAHALYLVARTEASLRAHGIAPVYPAVFATEFHRPTLLPATLKCTAQPAVGPGGYEAMLRAPGGVQVAVVTEDGLKPVITGTLKAAPAS